LRCEEDPRSAFVGRSCPCKFMQSAYKYTTANYDRQAGGRHRPLRTLPNRGNGTRLEAFLTGMEGVACAGRWVQPAPQHDHKLDPRSAAFPAFASSAARP